jgi:MYXO-CTERM domain-containing protein
VPGLLLAGAACSAGDAADTRPAQRQAAAAPIGPAALSGEVVVAEAVLQPAPGRWPAAALGGAQYLVVWEDFRAGRPALYAGRVGLDGAALDGAGLPLLDAVPDAAFFGQYESAVAFDGTNFLVVSAVGGQLRGVRVSGTGEVLDPGGFAITSAGSPVSRPSLVFDGQQYLVAWSRGAAQDRLDSGVYHARVKPDGAVVDPEGVRDFALAIHQTQVGVSFDGTNHLLSWVDIDPESQRPALYAARVGADGVPVDAAAFRVSPGGLFVSGRISPAAGFDGTNHVIAWLSISEDESGYTLLDVIASRVSPAGESLDPAGILVNREGVESSDLHRLDVTAGGGRSVVTWSQDYGGEGGPGAERVRLAQLAADGGVTVHPASAFTRGLEATLVTQPEGALLLWRDGEDPYGEYTRIVGVRLDAGGVPVGGGAVAPASTASSQDVRGVATDGHDFFVIWADTRDPQSEGKALYGARVAADGTPLDAEGIEITTGIADVASVVFDGANYVVTWTEHTGGEGDGSPFRFVRVTPAGERLDLAPEPELLASPDYTMASASDGTHTLLVGEDYNSAKSVLAAVLVDQQGKAVSDVVDIVTEDQPLFVFEPAVSFDGAGYLVVWNGGQEVRAQRIGADGALVGGHIPITSGPGIYHATTGFGGGNHLVLWEDAAGIFATRVTPAGEVLDPAGRLIAPVEPLCNSYGNCCARTDISVGACPSLAFDGTNFLVAWRAPAVAGDASSLDLQGAEVAPDGAVLRTFPISEEPEREGAPFLVASQDKQVLAGYTRFVPGAPFDTRRARARVLTADAEPGPGPDAGPGAPTPDAGPAPDAGGSPVEPPPGDGGGGDCGCTVGAAQPSPVAPLLLLGSLIGFWLVRRRGAR